MALVFNANNSAPGFVTIIVLESHCPAWPSGAFLLHLQSIGHGFSLFWRGQTDAMG